MTTRISGGPKTAIVVAIIVLPIAVIAAILGFVFGSLERGPKMHEPPVGAGAGDTGGANDTAALFNIGGEVVIDSHHVARTEESVAAEAEAEKGAHAREEAAMAHEPTAPRQPVAAQTWPGGFTVRFIIAESVETPKGGVPRRGMIAFPDGPSDVEYSMSPLSRAGDRTLEATFRAGEVMPARPVFIALGGIAGPVPTPMPDGRVDLQFRDAEGRVLVPIELPMADAAGVGDDEPVEVTVVVESLEAEPIDASE